MIALIIADVARAADLIEQLRLEPHPEGGFFRQVYKSVSTVQPDDQRSPRAAVTTIFFLLAAGQHSRWHRVQSDELWHFYEGDALELLLMPPALDRVKYLTVAPALGAGSPLAVAPAGWWQAARTRGAYSLVGCTVAPGFEYSDFSFLRDEAQLVGQLRDLAPELVALV